MQFSLRTLMVGALLMALFASAIAMGYQEHALKERAAEMEVESRGLKQEIGPDKIPLDEMEEYYQRIFDSVDKQSLELEAANEKYLALAASKVKLEIVDHTKISVLQIPDTSWDRPNLTRFSWRFFVPEANPDFGQSHLAVDFLPQKKDSTVSGDKGELKRLLKESNHFLPAAPREFKLPTGEYNVYLEIVRDEAKRTLRLLIDETCIHELRLIEECNGSSWSQPGGDGQKDIEIGKPFTLVRWTPLLPNSNGRETCLVRILPVLTSDAKESK